MNRFASRAWSRSPAAAAPSGPVTRISPSAPTPNWRSHRAATSSGDRDRRSRGSSIITKSLPVPWYLANWSSAMDPAPPRGRRHRLTPDRICLGPKVLLDLVHDLHRSLRSGREPSDPWVAAEPGELPSSQGPGAADGRSHGVLAGHPPRQVPGHLSVPDGLARGEGRAQPAVHELTD